MESKKKVIEESASSKSQNFKHRRSSLTVNLSYVSNLTDSGNGSLKQAESECGNVFINKRKKKPSTNKSLTKSQSQFHEDKQVPVSGTSSKQICLRDVRMVLEKISSIDSIRNKNCEKLKDAILRETGKIFDEQSEVSVKTVMVLGKGSNKDRSPLTEIKNSRIKEPGFERYVVEKNKVNSTIGDASTKENQNKDNNLMGKPTSKRKHLFLQNERLDDTSIVENNDAIETNLLQCQSSNSPILAESRKIFHTLRCSQRTSQKWDPQMKTECHRNNDASTCCRRSISSLSSFSDNDGCITAVPLGCSTMIEEEISNTLNETQFLTTDVQFNKLLAVYRNKNVVSMELTDVQGGSVLTTKHDTEDLIKNKTCRHVLQQNESKCFLCLERSLHVNTQTNKLMSQDIRIVKELSSSNKARERSTHKTRYKTASVQMELTVPEQSEISNNVYDPVETDDKCNGNIQYIHHNVQRSSDDSLRTVRSSLNVNTSVDAINEDEEVSDQNVPNISRSKECIPHFCNRHEDDIQLLTFNKEQESICTVCTSLQMNTSLNNSKRISVNTNSNEKKVILQSTEKEKTINTKTGSMSNIDAVENVNLSEILKNISVLGNINCEVNKVHTKSNEMSREQSVFNNISKNQTRRSTDSNTDDESNIAATPYPTSRSVLLKSQLRQNTIAHNFNGEGRTLSSVTNNINNDQSKLKTNGIHSLTSKSHYLFSKQSAAPKEANDEIIVDDSFSEELTSTKQQTITIIDDSGSETDSKDCQNIVDPLKDTRGLPKRPGKRKLLPLRESSQLFSFTPVEEEHVTPKGLTKTKKQTKTKNKPRKNKCNATRIEQTENTHDEQLLLENEFNILNDKKQNQKRPKRIRSKNIITKKIVNEDIVQIFQKNNENSDEIQNSTDITIWDSVNDFQVRKRSSTKSTKIRSCRIVIVATGLSKKDKDLVGNVIKTLGTAKLETNVTCRTTHVVSTGARTLNLLHGIIQGCWIVKIEWVVKSLEHKVWLNPEEYEIHFSKAVLENRKDKQLFGASYVPELFAICGYIYVEEGTVPPCSALKDLIEAGGGHITDNERAARIIIGRTGIKETWVLDCITTGVLQSCNQYQRQ